MAARPELALVVGAARSGTTLTRLLLDAHPNVGCPSEAGVPALMAHLARVWLMINADALKETSPGDPGVRRGEDDAPARWEPIAAAAEKGGDVPAAGMWDELPRHARRWIVEAVSRPMAEYCEPTGKRIYCDKSLDSVYHLGLVRELFPEVRMVLVFRHVMDTIASGIEASPWGFRAYGYAPYVQTSPGNSVAALASYWLDHVSRALAWEKEHPETCFRLRYEDLVLEPTSVVTDMQRFLGIPEDLAVLTNAFDRDPPRGPGDYKVEHTGGVHSRSIGHGKRVPVGMLPPRLLAALNDQLEALGYEALDRSWNTAERLVDLGGGGVWADRLRELMAAASNGLPPSDLSSVAVVAEDHRDLRWIVEPELGTVEQGDGDVEGVVTGTAEDLVLMLSAEENLGVLLRSGRVRFLLADDDDGMRPDPVQRLAKSLASLQRAVADGGYQPVRQ